MVSSRWLIGLCSGGLALLVGVPLLFVLLQAVFPQLAQGSLATPLAHLGQTLGEGAVLELTGNTVKLGLAVVVLAALIGAPLGVLRGLFQVPGQRLWDLAFLVPFMVPPYIAAMGWILLLQPSGFGQQLAGFHLAPLLFSFAGVVLVMALNLFPAVYFAVSRAVASQGVRLADVARIFGASPWRAFVRVTLPLTLPALAASLLLVFAASIEEYGTPAVLASNAGFFVLVTGIERRFSDWPIDLPGAALLSVILMLLALTAFVTQRWLTAGRDYATQTGKPADVSPRPLGAWRWPVCALFLLVALVATAAPLLAIAATAFTGTLSGGLTLENLSLRHFTELFGQGSQALSALAFSFSLAIGAALLTGLFGAILAYAVLRVPGRAAALLDALSILPNAMPGIVVAVGLILAWNQPWLPFTPYNTWMILLLAYACLLLPYPVRYAHAALRQIGTNLEASAFVHGAGFWVTLRRIVLPLLAPSVGAAMLLVFAIASRELVASLLLAPTGSQTVSLFIWRQFDQGSVGQGMAMSLLTIAITCLLVAGAHGLSVLSERRRRALA
ncbi:iron ABC transporter permease [Corticibacter populi]|uniref:Iron ABC transporter permease n=1 Tax=Corticibacter populi TaxID=1550736 RepID=A0A3M6QZQ4_9BURK|nr:iron ABC transporter permease [Corticibacter populi]RMX08431.1 iron ABC transporter permease [Corticibacter populi]RZS35737.1 iron(III) transport system permease protein [Corticibacter populi]